MAGQAIPDNSLSFLNNDSRAHGAPQDAEMFHFEVLDAAANLVRIKSLYSN